jgi:hypothetical protein
MLPNPKGFYESKKFNLVADHQSLELLFLTHMLFKSSLPYLIKKLTTRRTFLPNPKFYN